ncbi:MAG: OmpA family protein, partial [Ignavibacteriae bacterium]|nr:OmpA family protein [Ignavibacteriota bacterium]
FTGGCGERMPIADNETEEGRAINRRIEFSIYDGISSKCPKIDQPEFSNKEEKQIADALQSGEQLAYTNIQFKVNSDIITEPSKETLDNVVHVLKKLTDLKLEIQGHTDSDGAEAYNQDLSERRAVAVKNYIVSNGIEADRLTTVGYGESKPLVENTSRENKAKNRRIEFVPIK